MERATADRLRKLRGVDSAVRAAAVAGARQYDEAPNAALLRELRITIRSLVEEAWSLEAARGADAGDGGSVDGEGDEDADLAAVIGSIGA